LTTKYALHLPCAAGLETLLRTEVETLGLAHGDIQQELGRLRFETDLRGLHRALLELGLAAGVEVTLARFKALSFSELVQKVSRLPWADWLVPGQAFDVQARSKKSKLYHSGGIEERVAKGMLTVLGQPEELPAEEAMEFLPRVQVRFVHDVAEISLDLAGRPLHQRGYRLDPGQAPLREDLARALVLLSGWDRESVLLDPFCGSGTLLIEAAWLARGHAPGLLRPHALESTAIFDHSLWTALKLQAKGRVLPTSPARLLGSDRDARALRATRANAERAGVLADLELAEVVLAEAPLLCKPADAPSTGYLVTNPPFGKRLGGAKLTNLYQSLGHLQKAMPVGWQLALAAADTRLARKVGIPLESRARVSHGGLSVHYLCAQAAQAAPGIPPEKEHPASEPTETGTPAPHPHKDKSSDTESDSHS
jgi:putative N6-adenine-specific DNA methylase